MRARISVIGDQANAHSSEPSTNNTAPAISDFFRPSAEDIQAAPSAPMAAPSIMALTIHSTV